MAEYETVQRGSLKLKCDSSIKKYAEWVMINVKQPTETQCDFVLVPCNA